MSDRGRMGRAARRKGKAGEAEVLRMIRAAGWPDAERREDGQDQGHGDISHGPPATYIEVRRRERLSVPEAMREVLAKAPVLDTPILVHRPSRCGWMATLELDELLVLLRLREAAW